MGPTWGPYGADRTEMGPMLAPWTLLSGYFCDTRTHRSTPSQWTPLKFPSVSATSHKWSGQTSQRPCFLLQQGCHTLLKHQHPCFLLFDWDIRILPMQPRWVIPQVTSSDISACVINTLRPRQNGRCFTEDVSDAFSWITVYKFWLRFHWSLFLRDQLTIFQHWFREWLGTYQVTSHYLNQWWLDYQCIYASLGINELTHLVLKTEYFIWTLPIIQLLMPWHLAWPVH